MQKKIIKVMKSGNSLYSRLPLKFSKKAGIEPGSKMRMAISGKTVLLMPAGVTFEEALQDITLLHADVIGNWKDWEEMEDDEKD